MIGGSLWLYIGLGVLLLVALFVCYVVIARRKSRAAAAEPAAVAEPEEGDTPPPMPDAAVGALASQLRRAFAQAQQRLKRHVAGGRSRYRAPWLLMLGATASGKTTLLDNLGLHYPLGKPSDERRGGHPPCNWWFLDQGVVLDVAGKVLGHAGEEEGGPGWRTLLRLLRHYRPKRPLDGVVLTISCADLVKLNRQDQEALSRLRDQAESLYTRLWQLQHHLGMRLPIYVLVTKCDEVPGFQGWSRNLPESRCQEMMGWSNPYTIDTAYLTSWVDEAFDHLHTHLFHSQIEIFTVHQEPQERDGVFAFPNAFQTLREPLRIYLDQLFTPSVYHESFFFRGIYFCGDRSGEAQPVFLRHLFERKILPEARLARPVARKSIAAQRTMRTAQALAALLVVVGGLGLWRAGARLASQEPVLLQSLGNLQNELHDIDAVVKRRRQRKEQEIRTLGYESRESITAYTKDLQAHARRTINEMNQIPTRALTSLFLPASWLRFSPQFEFAPLSADVRRAVSRVYNHIILRAMFYHLAVKAEQLAIAPRDAGSEPPGAHLNVLQTHMRQLAKLQDNYTKLNDIQDDKNVRRLFSNPEAAAAINALMSELFGADTQLPETFFQDPSFYRYLADEGQIWLYDPQRAAPQTEATQTLAQRYYRSLFHPNAVMQHLNGLMGHLLAIEAGEGGAATFRQLLACMEETQRLLEAPDTQWLTQAEFNPDKRFNEVLTAIQESPFLGAEVSAEIKAAGAAEFTQLKSDLQALQKSQASDIGPLLQAPDGETPLQLSADLLALHSALKKWLRLPFMAQERPGATAPETRASACAPLAAEGSKRQELAALTPPMPRHNRLVWDDDLLQEATQIAPQYERFMQNDLKAFPDAWRRAIASQSLDHVEAHLRRLLARAPQLVDPPAGPGLAETLRVDVKRFQESAKPINTLLQTLAQLDIISLYWELLDVAAQQAQHLLPQVDALLAQDVLYTPRDDNFAWWMGDADLALQAFGVTDAAGLSQYLQAQHQRVTFLATQYARPLIAFLDSYPVDLKREDAERLARWRDILAELDRYDKQTPGNSVAALEQFILALKDATPETCLPESSDAPLTRRDSDYFLQRRDHMRQALRARCEALTDRIVYARYQDLAERFTRQLAGRFPFSPNAPQQPGVEVSPEAIRAFYQTFDVSAPTIRAILERNAQFGAAGDRVLTFLQQLEMVRRFFTPFIERIGGMQSPVFDLQVEFRVNQLRERNADQIIDWRFQVGDQLLRRHGSKKSPQGRWRYGDPVQLSLRWAKNAPWTPLEPDNPNGGSNHTVVYRGDGHWSLLRFLQRHAGAATDFDQLVDLRPHTLGFSAAVKPASAKLAQQYEVDGETLLTKAFIRVTLLSPDKKERLTMPVFPASAPALPEQIAGHQR